jgi:uncharacterized protein (DUF305 family)
MKMVVWRHGAAALIVAIVAFTGATGLVVPPMATAQETPTTLLYSCDTIDSTRSTPMADMDEMAMQTPTAETDDMADMQDMGSMSMGTASNASSTEVSTMPMEFDLHYIDMMIPHHLSIIGLAQAALPTLTDPRLQAIAQDIIDNQDTEIDELKGYRQTWYGSPEPLPMDDAMMQMMMTMMPTMAAMSSMDQMTAEMNAQAQVQAFCSADDPDLAFIDLTIPHHQMAIASSQDALSMATHQELKDFAQNVIDAQQQEIDELTQIRAELTDGATPAA